MNFEIFASKFGGQFASARGGQFSRHLQLHEAMCFVSNSVLADSFRLRNRQLLVAAKR